MVISGCIKECFWALREKRIGIIKPTFQDDTTVAYLGKNLKLSIIQDSDCDQNKIEFKNNEFFVYLKIGEYKDSEIAKEKIKVHFF